MDTWPIIKLTIGHCGGLLLVCAAFAASAYIFGIAFPNDTTLWWVHRIELVLVIITTTALAIIFLSSLARIVLDAVMTVWKGFPNVNSQSILA